METREQTVRSNSGKVELTWTNKAARLVTLDPAPEGARYPYRWVTPADYRAAEVRLLDEVERVGDELCAQISGGDDGNRTRVNGFADRSLATRARRHAHRALAAPRGFEPRFTDPKSAVLPARRRGIGATASRLAGHRSRGRRMERKTGLEPATLTLAR